MGQMSHGVILASDAGPAPRKFTRDLGDGWWELLSKYPHGKGPEPRAAGWSKDTRNLLGFWVAIGNEGEYGAPGLTKMFPLQGVHGSFLDVPMYRKSYQRALRAWSRFAIWSAREGFPLGPPALYFVPVEVG